MHINGYVRGKGNFVITEYVATDECTGPRFPQLLTTGRILNQYKGTQANVVTTEHSDWATDCPEYKVTAVQVTPSNGPTEWQEQYGEVARKSRRIAPVVEAAE
jgi:predicted molibdopterin-dependent oxidoreductase YjgC